MPKKKDKSDRFPVRVGVGEQLFTALTQWEIARLLDLLFAVLSSEITEKVLEQLQPDTRQTVQDILSEPQAVGQTQAVSTPSVSLAKLAQTWSELWRKWDAIVAEATQEDGEYMAQEAHWEPPYFDSTAFIDDLEKVAANMQPLLQTAFENELAPDISFAEALLQAEEEISAAMPDWLEIHDGFYLEKHLTHCLLTWEWLLNLAEEQDAFGFAQRIRQWENDFSLVVLEDNTVLEFFTQLSEADQRLVFAGLTADKKTPLWQEPLANTYSYWHALYMHDIEQYAPERYLDTLRPTISQQWQNGLPIIEDLLAKGDYQESLTVIEETLAALLKYTHRNISWTPETALFYPLLRGTYDHVGQAESYKTLLQYYQQTAQGLGQSQRVNALEIQLRALEHGSDWQKMFQAFAEVALPKAIRQALLRSWQDHIVQQASPSIWDFAYRASGDTWWLHWLIESIVDAQKGSAWFQSKLTQWLARLPGKRPPSEEDFAHLRLLTKDVTEMNGRTKNPYAIFYRFVIEPGDLSASDDTSRQAYLKQYASDDIREQVMACWQAHLQDWMPKPEMAQQSDYTVHAQWMAALQELVPHAYETLLEQWRVDHRRRRNLWRAMDEMGLG
jgi:hypothetical protein